MNKEQAIKKAQEYNNDPAHLNKIKWVGKDADGEWNGQFEKPDCNHIDSIWESDHNAIVLGHSEDWAETLVEVK